MKTKLSLAYGFIAILLALVLAGCKQPTTSSPPAFTGITAAYTGGDVALGTPTNNLKADLTVTAHYSNNSSKIIAPTNYSLSGDLSVVGDRVITVSYTDGTTSTTTFTVTVIASGAATVTGVTVNPATAVVAKGGTQVFTATVSGNGNPAQTVTWSVSGGVAGTAISADGLLTVAAGETATALTVTATSTLDTSKSGTASVTVSGAATVTGVTVSPVTANIEKGGTETFTATVTGTNNPAQTVTWSVSGGEAGTTITAEGLLTVATGETAAALTVKAVSTVDTSKEGTASVTVSGAATVTGVMVSPATAIVANGDSQAFTATVTGEGNPAQTVTWSVSGGGAGTSISPAGLLTVVPGETALSLTVTATSTVDPTKSGTASVTVPVPTVSGVMVSPTTTIVANGDSQAFTATVTGTYNPAQTVTWSVSGGGAGTTISPAGVLTVAAGEAPKTLTVTATSTADPSKSGTASVTVPTPTVTGVTITPETATVSRGGLKRFTARVNGTYNPPQTVTWSVSGNSSVDTVISAGGMLTIASDEYNSLIIRATSTYDPTKTSVAAVTVTDPSSVYSYVRTAFDTNSSLQLQYSSYIYLGWENELWARVYNYYNEYQTISYAWYINGTLQTGYTGNEVRLPVGNLSPGIYYGLVIVTIDDVAFSQDFAFRVAE